VGGAASQIVVTSEQAIRQRRPPHRCHRGLVDVLL